MRLFSSFVILVLLFIQVKAQSPAKAVFLRCEYLENPLGIDAANPRLTWRMEDSRQGAVQTGFEIWVDKDSLALLKGTALSWNQKKISGDVNLISYAGKKLEPFTKYYWRVFIWDREGKKSRPSLIASFETGMMDVNNWKGAWIGDSRDENLKPAPYFRKKFNAAKTVKSARAYIAVAGLYEFYINGAKISNHRLDPMYTRFDRRILYVTHDITSAIQKGENVAGVLLGNGWYNHQSTAVWYFHEAPWRSRPAFCLNIRITYSDGSVETIVTEKGWKTSLSPVIFNSIYTAEHYDARLEQQGWNTVSFQDTAWKDVIYRSAPSQNIVSQVLHPVRNVEEIKTESIHQISDSVYVFNIGRNISGVSKFSIRGEAGTIIRLKHGERLYSNGRVDQSNIDAHYRPTDKSDPFQEDIFILSGKGEEIFMPLFNYKGFQYVEVSSGKPLKLSRENLQAYFMHSDVPSVGQIHSSDITINKIWKATNNSYLSNLFGYPTDCPQREKNGWTGDAHIASETGLFNFDGITVYEKWMADHRDEQQPNGVLPSIIPSSGWGYEWGNGPDWTSTIAIIPWNLYLFYGDKKPLADCYENIKRYVDHIDEMSPSGLTSWGLGDWVPVKSKSPVELTSSVYYFVDASILSKAAGLLGNKADQTKYLALAEKIKKAINDKYLNKATGIYGLGLQTELSVPLYWGIVPAEIKQKVADNLALRVKADNNHLDVGLLGTKAILQALSDNGYAQTAYILASQKTFPSWGWWMENGATTLYENWPIDAKSDISMNHIMFGEIGAWFYKGLAGLKADEKSPGFKHVLLQPHFVEGLDSFASSHEGPNGKIVSSWKKMGSTIQYEVAIPANSSATVQIEIPKGMSVYEENKKINGINSSYTAGESFITVVSFNVNAGLHSFVIRKELVE